MQNSSVGETGFDRAARGVLNAPVRGPSEELSDDQAWENRKVKKGRAVNTGSKNSVQAGNTDLSKVDLGAVKQKIIDERGLHESISQQAEREQARQKQNANHLSKYRIAAANYQSHGYSLTRELWASYKSPVEVHTHNLGISSGQGSAEPLEGKNCLVVGRDDFTVAAAKQLIMQKPKCIYVASSNDGAVVEALKSQRSNGNESDNVTVKSFASELLQPEKASLFAQSLADAGVKLDRIVIADTLENSQPQSVSDNIDPVFKQGFLEQFALLEALQTKKVLVPAVQNPPRVIFLVPGTHHNGRPLDFESKTFGEVQNGLTPYERSTQSQLALATYASHLAETFKTESGEEPTVGIFLVSSGLAGRDVSEEAPWYLKPFVKVAAKAIPGTLAQSAQPVAWMCCQNGLEREHQGQYMDRHTWADVASIAQNESAQHLLVERSQQLLQQQAYRQ